MTVENHDDGCCAGCIGKIIVGIALIAIAATGFGIPIAIVLFITAWIFFRQKE